MKKFVELFLVSFLAITLASGAASITATRIPTAIADGGGAGSTGYPYAVFVTISGWTTAANSQAYVKLYNSTNNEYMWSSSNAWSNTTTYNTANQPVVNIDASGNWSGWIYAKHNTSLGTAASVRAAKVGATSTNLTSSSQTFTILNTATSGGWIIGQTSSAVNKGIVAYSGGSMVGTYRTEDNSITEGYSYGSGGFKIAVPIGSVDSLVAYNDDGSAFQTFIGPWIISAGVETDFSSVSVLASGSASVSPYMWKYNSPTNLQFVIKPTTDTLKGIRIIKPSILSWNTGAITVLPNSAGLSFNGDTVQISNISLSGQDSVVLTCDGTTAIDTTNIFSVIIQTSNDGISYGQISTLPQVFIYGSPRAISAVKQKEASGAHTLLGKWVVIKGIVTVANEFAGGNAPGGPAYIQDETGAATLYDTAIVNNVQRGDEIIVLGVVAPFNDLFELAPCSLLETVSSGNPFDTTVVTIAQLLSQVPTAVEQYEGKLVRINGITSVNTATWTVTGSGTNYNITDATGTMQTRISPRVNLANLPAPSGAFDMVCVVGQFNTTYQVLPRSYDDIIVENQGPRIISQSPFESNIQPTSLTISWITDVAGTSVVKYGKTSSLDLTVSDTNKVTQHQAALPNLTSATTYFVQIQTANAIGTTTGPVFLSSTSSQNSSGTINVYFNKSVNTTVALGENAQTVSNLSQKAIDRINAATYSIDVALYSFSGTVGTNIANALVAAKNRNVKVRVIGESENQGSTSKWSTLTNAGIPVIFDTYDATNGGAGLMHDKFYIFDTGPTWRS